MRIAVTVASISWVPSESLTGPLRTGVDLGIVHWDEPPPDRVRDPVHIRDLCRRDRFRFANVLGLDVDVEDGAVVRAAVRGGSGLVMGSTTMRVGPVGATFRAARMPVLRRPLDVRANRVRLRQTVGGRTAAPLPRRVPHPPFVRWQAPLVWTTLQLEVRADGAHSVALVGASAFPRHWVYGGDGRMTLKSGVADQTRWLAHSFGVRTPWGRSDREALVAAGESDLERMLSAGIMRRSPAIRQVPAGAVLARQGEPGTELLLLLDGIVRVEVDGHGPVGEVGPGAVLGERALIGDGRRTATLTAVTPVRIAAAPANSVDVERLRALAAGHRREDAPPPGGQTAV